MQLDYTQPLTDVFCRVMESMAFYFLDPIEADEARDLSDTVSQYQQVTMRFDGPHKGSILMYMPLSMFTTLSANMLGVDEGDQQALSQQNDAVRELLNIVCGQSLTEIWGTGPVFDLRIPQMVEVSTAELHNVIEHTSACCFKCDGGLVILDMCVDQTA